MTPSLVGAALAWLIISLHVKAHGGSVWFWFFGYLTMTFGMAVTVKILEAI